MCSGNVLPFAEVFDTKAVQLNDLLGEEDEDFAPGDEWETSGNGGDYGGEKEPQDEEPRAHVQEKEETEKAIDKRSEMSADIKGCVVMPSEEPTDLPLNPELVALILSYLPFLDKLRVMAVCRRWRRILTAKQRFNLWKDADLSPFSHRLSDSVFVSLVKRVRLGNERLNLAGCRRIKLRTMTELFKFYGPTLDDITLDRVQDTAATFIEALGSNCRALRALRLTANFSCLAFQRAVEVIGGMTSLEILAMESWKWMTEHGLIALLKGKNRFYGTRTWLRHNRRGVGCPESTDEIVFPRCAIGIPIQL